MPVDDGPGGRSDAAGEGGGAAFAAGSDRGAASDRGVRHDVERVLRGAELRLNVRLALWEVSGVDPGDGIGEVPDLIEGDRGCGGDEPRLEGSAGIAAGEAGDGGGGEEGGGDGAGDGLRSGAQGGRRDGGDCPQDRVRRSALPSWWKMSWKKSLMTLSPHSPRKQ